MSAVEKTMNRAAVIVLAAASLGWSAAATAVRAGDAADRSPSHSARGVSHATPAQRGTVLVEKHKAKQGTKTSRLFTHADRISPKHRYRSSRADRLQGKQAALNVRQLDRATRAGPKHHSQIAAAEYRKLKRGVKGSHVVAKKDRIEKKQAGRHASSRKS
jgi:hypothetical protein